MKISVWGYLFLVLGLIGIVLINVFGQVTITNEQNYYSLKEITKSAMIDSVDEYAYQHGVGYDGVTQTTDTESMHCDSNIPGTVRIIKERFVEQFMVKFAASADLNKDYVITFNDIDECPPKVTVTIKSSQNFSTIQKVLGYADSETIDSADIVNTLSAVLETGDQFE